MVDKETSLARADPRSADMDLTDARGVSRKHRTTNRQRGRIPESSDLGHSTSAGLGVATST